MSTLLREEFGWKWQLQKLLNCLTLQKPVAEAEISLRGSVPAIRKDQNERLRRLGHDAVQNSFRVFVCVGFPESLHVILSL